MQFTVSEVNTSLAGLIEQMVTSDQPEPDWSSLRGLLGNTDAEVLRYLAATNALGWLVSDINTTVWRWKHARLRDALTGRWLAYRVFQEWNAGGLSDLTQQWIEHPGLSEAWALALIWAPDRSGQIRLADHLAEFAPLALAHALRLGLFPEEGEVRDAIRHGLLRKLSPPQDRENEFVPGVPTLILAQLVETDDSIVLELTYGWPDVWDVRLARLRNGDLDVALRWFEHVLQAGDFPPWSNFREL